MDVENEKGSLEHLLDAMLNIFGMIFIVYVTAYFFIAITN